MPHFIEADEETTLPLPSLSPPPPPPAPKVTGPTTRKATRPSGEHVLPAYLAEEAKLTEPEAFDARRHLVMERPASVLTMGEIGYGGRGISDTAVSEPFRLFSQGAIRQIRREVFSDEVLEDCQFSSSFNKNLIRGMGPHRAPFTYDAWYSPELLAHVSSVAGIDLVPAWDYEVANINVSIGNGRDEAAAARQQQDGDNSDNSDGKEPVVVDPKSLSAVGWHYDSFAFVCVVMLSDCAGMVGGETALRTGSGEIIKTRGPTMGTAVVMQGRYIEHQALRALGGRERTSMVTPFRPANPLARDETLLAGVRAISHVSQLYHEYCEYRFEVLRERLRLRLKEERRRQAYNSNSNNNNGGKKGGVVAQRREQRRFNPRSMRRFLAEQRAFIDSMMEEIVEEGYDDDDLHKE